jgi:hypothetical protein
VLKTHTGGATARRETAFESTAKPQGDPRINPTGKGYFLFYLARTDAVQKFERICLPRFRQMIIEHTPQIFGTAGLLAVFFSPREH